MFNSTFFVMAQEFAPTDRAHVVEQGRIAGVYDMPARSTRWS